MDHRISRMIWFIGLLLLFIGSILSLVSVSKDYLTGSSEKSIGDSQLGVFFSSLAMTLLGALLLQMVANEHHKLRIRSFEKVHPDIKAAQMGKFKKLFHPMGFIVGLIGIAVMIGLVMKDYKAPLTFNIGPLQILSIFGGCVLCIGGIAIMSVANSIMTATMAPMPQQFEVLTKEEPVEKPKRKLKVKDGPEPEEPESDAAKVEEPELKYVVAGTPSPETVPTAKIPEEEPTPEVEEKPQSNAPVTTEPETVAPIPLSEPPFQVEKDAPSIMDEPPVEPIETDKTTKSAELPAWSDDKAEELAIAALQEAEVALGLDGISSDLGIEPEPNAVTAPEESKSTGIVEDGVVSEDQEDLVEVFECPNCQKTVGQMDTKCPHCGVTFEEDEVDAEPSAEKDEGQIITKETESLPTAQAAVPETSRPEPEKETKPPAKASPLKMPPPLPPPARSSSKDPVASKPKVKSAPVIPEPEAKTSKRDKANLKASKAKDTDEEGTMTESSGVLQSILDEITLKDDSVTKTEEETPIEEDVASEVPTTCPKCSRKIKPNWKSCPFCGLEFR